MTDTPLIVRKVTADRGVKAVTTHEVLECIKEMTGETFSTRELADALMVRHADIDYGRLEYSVRQSIVWQMPCKPLLQRVTPNIQPARRASLDAHKRRMRAAFFDRPVFCTRCRQWVDRAGAHMVPIGNGRGRVECRRHTEGA